MRHQLSVGSRFPIAAVATLLLGASWIAAGPAAAQSISGFSVSTAGSTANAGDGGGSRTSSVAVQINTATQVKSRFAWNINADVGAFTTRDTPGIAQHNVSFSVTAPGSYSLAVATQRVGDMNRVNDALLCNGAADIGALTGSFAGGTLASGTLSLVDPGAIASGTSTTSTPFNQSAAATINRTSNGAPQAHTLTFTWNGTVRSNSCEAAVRVGEGSGATSGCSACAYPGSPSRTQATDGHFETVTLTNLCGNGVVDTSAGFPGITSEQCDLGPLNGSSAGGAFTCCTSTCQFRTAGDPCRLSAGVCDPQETCTGSSAACPADALEPSSTVCRGAAGVCDIAENCTGSSADCPADALEPSSTVCRGAAGVCDIAENCDGSTVNCPADSVSGAFVTCRPTAGVCDIAEDCDGVGIDCPADAFQPSSTVCRGSAGFCDVVENCTGSGAACPTDAKSTVLCRPDAGQCDVADFCDGIGNDCPPDGFEPNGTVCDNGDLCDVADTCQTGVCVSAGPDTDADTICDSADNCPTDANTGQEDLDSDDVGDVCDPSDGLLNPIKIQMRVRSATSPSDSSSIKATGDFATLTMTDVFSASAPITLTLGDGKPVPSTRTHTWQPADCKSTARSVRCVSSDRLSRVQFKTSPKAPGVWKFKAQFKKPNLTGPVQGPTTAHLIYGPLTDRTGSIPDCKSTSTVLTCKDTQ